MNRIVFTVWAISILLLPPCKALAQHSESREWVDSTGKFKVTGTLVEIKDGNAVLKTAQNKMLKIPVSRLSKADQEFLKGDANPFTEMAESGTSSKEVAGDSQRGDTPGWDGDNAIDWETVEELDRSSPDEWKFDLPKQTGLGDAKKALLNKKNHFHEDIRRLVVDPLSRRAVVGYTVNFAVPKPQSRLAVIDLVAGKTLHTVPVEADMCPLAILNGGSKILMQGTSDERGGYETNDQLQIWTIDGRKVSRSKSWIPFPNESEDWGKKTNALPNIAFALPNDRLILMSSKGHLVCLDANTRKPYWHTMLSSDNVAIDLSADRSLLAIADGHMIMVVDPQAGAVKAMAMLEDKPHIGWPRLKWSASGKRLLYSFMSELRVLDLSSGKWIQKCTFPGGPIAAHGLDYPHDDFALVDNRLLIHIPTQIKLCEYREWKAVVSIGGKSFIALQDGDRGLVVPSQIPHPAAEKTLTQAQNDPSVFLIHPGVEVSIDASGAGQWAEDVAAFLKQAATESGYKVVDGSPISIAGSVSGPKQEAVSYIASGSYIANVYQSTIRIVADGKDAWSTGGNNIPGIIQTSRDESIQEKLDELGKSPNLEVFKRCRFPKLLQRPKDNQQAGSDALLLSKFTMQGLVDEN